MHRFFVLASSLAASLILALPGNVGATVPIDPNSLTPPPPASFTVTCTADGVGTVCNGTEVATFVDLDLGEDGFACEGRGVIDNGQQVRTGRFEYDAAGRATRWLVHGEFRETWRLAGLANPELHTLGRWSVDNDFVVPGDITSRTRSYRGQNLLVTGPTGVVASNAGLQVFDWDESNILTSHGRQDILDFPAFIASVCSAFAG